MEISRSTRLVLVVFCQLTVWTRTTSVEGRRFVDRQTSYGTVRGFVDVIKGRQKVEKYLGVPYAKPPVENLRFEGNIAIEFFIAGSPLSHAHYLIFAHQVGLSCANSCWLLELILSGAQFGKYLLATFMVLAVYVTCISLPYSSSLIQSCCRFKTFNYEFA
ncbi:neuroligin-2 isoform X2 [Biomphalaria glabrata]|nr:neuroligin-2 isoform X2 [Biomphalaria glabrata]